MRRERDTSAEAEPEQLLVDLGCMAMAVHGVRAHALADRYEVRRLGGLAPGAGDPALGVHHGVLDQACAGKRSKCQNGRCRVTARIGDEVRIGDLGPVELREAEYRLPEQLRRPMLAVPGAVRFEVTQTEVGGQIDYAQALRPKRGDDRCGGAV